ncbi:MAG TPA: PaaX family transcriptional regulator C-terminal domain-containing protein, partial [Burkholderiaceae bacterium]|nr:PaaX family transcriptional regulator C-terminal domain-containing protein [Burkholderiaceae bacterium]
APSVFAHPSVDAETLEEILTRVGVRGKVFICNVTESTFADAQPLGALVEQCWELGNVISDYQRLIERFAGIPKLLSGKSALSPEQAFVLRTLLIHEYRRVQLHDPQLPLELLPKNWPGKIAHELCGQIYRSTCASAEQYVLDTLRQEDEFAPEAAGYFYQRFGGLR